MSSSNNFSWQQTMFRIKDPAVSVPFYKKHFGMSLVDKYTFESFSLYFMACLPTGVTVPGAPGSAEAHAWLWQTDLMCLELTHNHGTENDETFKANNGNVEPHRGFGHIAFLTDDVYAAHKSLVKEGVKFQKGPDDGRMKGLAFALDPDGYWIEIIRRLEGHGIDNKYNLAQTMMRIKDPKASISFYEACGMTLVAEKHFAEAKFSLYFMASLKDGEKAPEQTESQEAFDAMKRRFHPYLELTHNHGTENDPAFQYHNGNTDPRGFGHIGFLVDDLQDACDSLDKLGHGFQKRPNEGSMKNLAFAKDPDGYWVEILPRGFSA